MVVGWRRRTGRSITVAVALLSLGIVICCGNTGRARADSGENRLGCGTYCQSAGFVAGTSDSSGQDAVTFVSNGRTVIVDADGYIPLLLTCNLSVQCRGSIRLDPNFGPGCPMACTGPGNMPLPGLSDLQLDAGATAVFGVSLPNELSLIPAHQPPCAADMAPGECSNSVGVIIDAGPSFGCAGQSFSKALPKCPGNVNGFKAVSGGSMRVVAVG